MIRRTIRNMPSQPLHGSQPHHRQQAHLFSFKYQPILQISSLHPKFFFGFFDSPLYRSSLLSFYNTQHPQLLDWSAPLSSGSTMANSFDASYSSSSSLHTTSGLKFCNYASLDVSIKIFQTPTHWHQFHSGLCAFTFIRAFLLTFIFFSFIFVSSPTLFPTSQIVHIGTAHLTTLLFLLTSYVYVFALLISTTRGSCYATWSHLCSFRLRVLNLLLYIDQCTIFQHGCCMCCGIYLCIRSLLAHCQHFVNHFREHRSVCSRAHVQSHHCIRRLDCSTACVHYLFTTNTSFLESSVAKPFKDI